MCHPICSIGKAQREGLYPRKYVPGPGAYESSTTLSGPRYHFAGKHAKSSSNITPGPANYTPDFKQRLREITHKYTIAGKAAFTSRAMTPGPGSYSIGVQKIRLGGRFGRDTRRSLSQSCNQLVPGPGNYQPEMQRVSSMYLSAPRYRFCANC